MSENNSAPSASLIAFFYCARNSAEPERSKPVEIMGALLRQLASSEPDVPIREPVAKEYEDRKRNAERDCSKLKKLTVENCTRLILELTCEHPATIVIDALDESEENNKLLEQLDKIVSESVQVVKVFVSSREDVDIVSSLCLLIPDPQLKLGGSRENLSMSAKPSNSVAAVCKKFQNHPY
jgi:hypothetical protein